MSHILKSPASRNPDDTAAIELLLILREALSPGTNVSLAELLDQFAAVIHDVRHEAVQHALREIAP